MGKAIACPSNIAQDGHGIKLLCPSYVYNINLMTLGLGEVLLDKSRSIPLFQRGGGVVLRE